VRRTPIVAIAMLLLALSVIFGPEPHTRGEQVVSGAVASKAVPYVQGDDKAVQMAVANHHREVLAQEEAARIEAERVEAERVAAEQQAAAAEAARQEAAQAAARRAQAHKAAPAAPRAPSAAPAAATGDVWDRLAQCESGGNWASNTGNGYYGGLQFSAGTWRSVGGSGLPSENSREEQIHRGQILQARSGWGQWPACSRKLGLR
jgi:resuscitation-promoting factor RpfB